MITCLNAWGNIPTGIGSEARWLWATCPFDIWLQAQHPILGWGAQVPITEGRSVTNDWPRVCEEADVVVCIERPSPPGVGLFAKKLVVLANVEWRAYIPAGVTVIARTNQCAQAIPGSIRCQVPIALEELPYTQRHAVNTVRFSAGWGGVHARKGLPEVLEMNKLGANVEIFNQRMNPVPASQDLYRGADVMVVPSRFEGVGLTVLEAMASGCLVVATDAEPMSEFIKAAYGNLAWLMLLPVERVDTVIVGGLPWPSSRVSPEGALKMLETVRRMPEDLVRHLSRAGREYVAQRHGAEAAQELWRVICQ